MKSLSMALYTKSYEAVFFSLSFLWLNELIIAVKTSFILFESISSLYVS